VLAVLAGRTTIALWRFATGAPELPLWDEAKYGLDGVRLAAAVAELDLARWVAIVYGLDVWPPLFPVVESIAFLAGGPSVAVARGLIAPLFLGAVAAAFWAGREIAPASPAVAVAAAALVLTSPFVQLFAAHAMLEVPGALLLLVALAAYARSLRHPAAVSRSRALVAAGLLATALFFTKYNYAVLWIVPLLVNEAWTACGGARAVVARALERARAIDWRRPWTAFVALYALGLVAIAVTGGGSVRIGGAELRATSIGNPLYLLILIAGIRAASTPRRSSARFRQWVRGLAPRRRVLLWTTAAPVAVWLLLPPHLRSFVDFLDNRGSGLAMAPAGLLYHPRVFIEQYHGSAWVGTLALALALAAIPRMARAAPGVRVVLLGAVTGLAATMIHPYKEPRFFFTVAPLVWLGAAWNAATLAEGIVRRAASRPAASRGREPGDAATARLAVAAALTAAVLLAAAAPPALTPGLPDAFARHTVPASTALLLDRVVELARAQPALVIGTWNQHSPMLIEWRFRELLSDRAPLPELAIPTRRREAAADELARRLRAPGAPPRVLSIELDAASAPSPEWAAAYAAETAWLDPLRASLTEGALPFALAAEEPFAATGYRLRVFRLVSPGSPATPAE
jgi:hypothetical protein